MADETPAEATVVDASTLFPGVTLNEPVTEHEMAGGHHVYEVARSDLFLAARSLKDQGYRILSCLSASDDKKGPMQVFYSFIKPTGTADGWGERRLRVVVPKEAGDKPVRTTCPSLTDIFPAADWHEREMYDMYGIVFEGHPDLRRMFLPEGWKGYPMRKDDAEGEQFVAMQDGEDIVLSTQEEGSW